MNTAAPSRHPLEVAATSITAVAPGSPKGVGVITGAFLDQRQSLETTVRMLGCKRQTIIRVMSLSMSLKRRQAKGTRLGKAWDLVAMVHAKRPAPVEIGPITTHRRGLVVSVAARIQI